MPTGPLHVRIGLIGPTKAGKTSLFDTFQEALDRGRHGFSHASELKIRPTAAPRPMDLGEPLPEDDIDGIIGSFAEPPSNATLALQGEVAATTSDRMVERAYALTYREPVGRELRTIDLSIADAAGEHSFGRDKDPSVAETRRKLHRHLAGCDGFVVVVPFSGACEAAFVRTLEGWLSALAKYDLRADRQTGRRQPRPVVIALTRYDSLFADFGSAALRVASEPTIATDVINRLVSGEGSPYEDRIAKFDATRPDGAFRISFAPTSAYGFVPGFGCVNINPYSDDAFQEISLGRSPRSFPAPVASYPGQHLFPFLTADPFVFAAIGLDNPFVVPIDCALRRVSFADRRSREQSRAPDARPARAREDPPPPPPRQDPTVFERISGFVKSLSLDV